MKPMGTIFFTSMGKHPDLDPDLCTHSLGKFMGSFRHFLPLTQLRVAAVLEPISPVTGCKMEYRSPMAGLTRRYRHHSRVLTFTPTHILVSSVTLTSITAGGRQSTDGEHTVTGRT